MRYFIVVFSRSMGTLQINVRHDWNVASDTLIALQDEWANDDDAEVTLFRAPSLAHFAASHPRYFA